MTPEERAAIDAAMNLWARGALTHLLVLLTLASCAWLAWQHWGHVLPNLGMYFSLRPRPVSSLSAQEEHTRAAPAAMPNSTERANGPNERTNERHSTPRTVLHQTAERLQLDKTRPAVVAVLVAAGWKTTDIRDVLKGTAADIGDEVKAAQAAQAGDEPPRSLVVRDAAGERTIAL